MLALPVSGKDVRGRRLVPLRIDGGERYILVKGTETSAFDLGIAPIG